MKPRGSSKGGRLRRMTGIERKATLALAGGLLFSGELKDDVRVEVASYLKARGWATMAAIRRAREVVDAAQTRGDHR